MLLSLLPLFGPSTATGPRQMFTVNIQSVPTLHEDETYIFLASVHGPQNMSVMDLTFTWDFGDLASNTTNPDKVVLVGNATAGHVYTKMGTYLVGLTVKDNGGNVTSASANVNVVNVVPTPDITIIRRSTFEDEPITFLATGTIDTPSDVPSLQFSWTFDNGQASMYSSTGSIEQTYNQAGTHTVTLKAKDMHGAEGTITKTFSVDNQPPLAIAGKDVVTRQDQPVQFDGRRSIDTPSDMALGLKYRWDFGDGNFDNGSKVSHSFSGRGQFNVVLTVMDDDGASTKDQVKVTVLNSPPIAVASFTQIAGSDFVTFDASKSTDSAIDQPFLTYQWSFGDGSIAMGKTVTHHYSNIGPYTVELMVMDPVGASSLTYINVTVTDRTPTVHLGAIPEVWMDQKVNIIADSINSPDGGPVDASWELDNQQVSGWGRLNGTSAVYALTIHDTNQHTLRLYLRSGQGALVYYNINFKAKDPLPLADFNIDWVAFAGQEVALNASRTSDNPSDMATLFYKWSLGDGTTADGKVINHIYSTPGEYTINLTVTDRSGGNGTVKKVITVISQKMADDLGGNVLKVIYTINEMLDNKSGINPGETILVDGQVNTVEGWNGPNILNGHTANVVVSIDGTDQKWHTISKPGSGRFTVLVQAPMKVGRFTLRANATFGPLSAEFSSWLFVREKQTATSPVSMPMATGVVTATAGLIAIAAVGGTDLGRYKFFTLLIPLFTRLRKQRILDHFERGRIYEHIRKTPGDSYSSIRKALGIKNGALAHHLRVLEVHEYIISRRDGMYKRFYPKGMRIPEGKHMSIQEQMLEMIMGNPKITQKQMAERLGIDRSTVNYHIKILLAMGVIRSEKDGKVKYYYFVGVKEPLPYEG